MACSRATVAERAPGNRNELPLVRPVAQGELQHSVRVRLADLAVLADSLDCSKPDAARSHDKRTDSAARVESAMCVERSETFVVVVMSAEDDIGARVGERLPEWLNAQSVTVLSRAEARVVPHGGYALTRVSGKVRTQPLFLGASRDTGDDAAIRVQSVDTPRANVVRVVALARLTGGWTEVGEVRAPPVTSSIRGCR